MRIFRIADGRECFFQWDTDQRLIVNENIIQVCTQIHFCNGSSSQALVVEVRDEDGVRYCEVPNILLQEASPIKCYTCRVEDDMIVTTHESIFDVISRSKPYDYVYTETEVLSYGRLEKKLNDVLANVNVLSVMDNSDIDEILDS